MIRILHIVTYMGRGGLETMLMNYYRHIDRAKIQFDFLVHRDFEADYDKEIQSLGGKIFRISKLVPWSFKYKRELRQFFNAHREYRIIHVHQDCLSSVALKIAKECNIPIRIAHSHSSSAVKNLKYPVKLFYMKKIPKYATSLLACGKDAGDWMFSGKKYSIVANAIDIDKYKHSENDLQDVKKEFGISDEIIIGHVGQFREEKNHAFIISIFNEIYKLSKNTKLLLVGDGDIRHEIEQLAESLNIKDNTIFAGSRSDVPKILQVMNCFILPSLYEGVPLSIIEAQASGIPCVISNHVSSECIVTNGLVHIKKLSDSPKAWARCILEYSQVKPFDHSKEIEQYGYEINSTTKRLEKFYISKYKELDA